MFFSLSIKQQHNNVFVCVFLLKQSNIMKKIVFILLLSIICYGSGFYAGISFPSHDEEYQFVVTDDSVSVTDYDRHVGTIKLDGELEKLITNDNK